MGAAMLSRCAGVAVLACASLVAGGAGAEGLAGSLPVRRGAEPVSDGGLWTPTLLLAGLAAAAGGVVWWRRGGRGASSTHAARRAAHAVTRVSSHALTPQASVHAIQWNGEEFLVGCTGQQVTLLARRPVEGGAGEQA